MNTNQANGGGPTGQVNEVVWEDLSISNQCYRYEAVRNRMGQFGLSASNILDHLALANGNVNDAVDSLQRTHTLSLNQPIPTTGIPIQYFHTADQERRAAADNMPLFANQGRDPANQIVLSRAEAALLLELANGDMDQVIALLDDYDGATETLRIRYDGLRRFDWYGRRKTRTSGRDACPPHTHD